MRFEILAVAALALISTSLSTDAFVPKTGSAAFHRSARALSSVATVREVPTKPIAGMKPGTSGLRKKVEIWQAIDPSNQHYVENFIQSLIDAATAKNDGKVPHTYVS